MTDKELEKVYDGFMFLASELAGETHTWTGAQRRTYDSVHRALKKEMGRRGMA